MNHIDLFSGIGGFALAVDTVWKDNTHIFCEIDPFCQKVLSKHFPESKIYGDIRKFTRQGKCDILTGGFPCQPFSHAGKRGGREDNRFLWPQMLRVIQKNQPTWIIAENVGGILTIEGGMVFEQVCSDLEDQGYGVQTFIIPACAVNAPHRRDRVWFVAHADHGGSRGTQRRGDAEKGGIQKEHRAQNSSTGQPIGTAIDRENAQHDSHSDSEGRQRGGSENTGRSGQPDRHGIDKGWSWDENWTEVAAKLCRMDDGLPARLDGFELSKSAHRTQRLKALGNAIVPQVAVEIMKAISLQTQT